MAKSVFCNRGQAGRHQTGRAKRTFLLVMFGIALVLVGKPVLANEQIKGLDEQVQEIKSDVLAIAAELNRLEEKLLYPSGTQVAVFVSLADQDSLLLDAVQLRLDEEEVANHLYSYKELQALRRGGVQRLYTGNVRSGEHALEVTLIGRREGGRDFTRTETYRFTKSVGPKLLEIAVDGPDAQTIALKEL